jgi:hypothetical protein
MAEREQPKQPTHRVYSVIRREGQDDFWLNVGLVFPHKDGDGFNIMLQALPLDGKLVCRVIGEAEDAAEAVPTNQARDNDGRSRRQRQLR